MQELTADMFISVDGFATGASRGQDFNMGGPEFTRLIQEVLEEPQRIIMGRVTYEEMPPYWPTSILPIAAQMNALPKLVFSRTLTEPLGWNNARLAKRDLAEEINTLKRESGGTLRFIGSIHLVREMVVLGLVDRLRLVIFPDILGRSGGLSMFHGYDETKLELKNSSVVDSNIVILEYRPIARTHT